MQVHSKRRFNSKDLLGLSLAEQAYFMMRQSSMSDAKVMSGHLISYKCYKTLKLAMVSDEARKEQKLHGDARPAGAVRRCLYDDGHNSKSQCIQYSIFCGVHVWVRTCMSFHRVLRRRTNSLTNCPSVSRLCPTCAHTEYARPFCVIYRSSQRC